MNHAPLLLAFLDLLDISTPVIFLLRLAAAIGGALVGWIFGGPVIRLTFWFFFRKKIPMFLNPLLRLTGALCLALLFFYFAPIGGSGGGRLGGPGGGKIGDGPGGTQVGKGPVVKDPKGKPIAAKSQPACIDIEIIQAKNYKMDLRYYVVQGEPAPHNLAEVEAYLKNFKDPIEVCIVQSDESIGDKLPVDQLRDMLDKSNIASKKHRPK